MKPRSSHRTNHALTLVELLVIIAVLAVLVAILLPALISRPHYHHLNCVNNLKQIGLAYQIWSIGNDDKYPMGISVTNGGSMELIITGNVLMTFLVMSNELGTPKILHCAEDKKHIGTSSFDDLTSSNISYFVGVDVTNKVDPQAVLSGDDNLEVGDVPLKSGLFKLSISSQISWTSARHKFSGNILVADGGIEQISQMGLRWAFPQTSTTTNLLAIP